MFKWSSGDAQVLPGALTLIVILAVVFRLILGKSKFRHAPLMVLAVLIVLLEVAKQIYYNLYEPFTMYILPLHFCSTFILLMPLAQFTRGKFRAAVKPLPVCYALIVAVLMYAYPRALLGNSTSAPTSGFHNIHTLLYHHVIVAYFFWSVILGDYAPSKKDIPFLMLGPLVYACYAVPVAYVCNVNYVNILKSDFAPFEALRQSAGQVVYNIVLFLTAEAAILLIWLVYYIVYKALSRHHTDKIQTLDN